MGIKTNNNGHPEESISEQFGYERVVWNCKPALRNLIKKVESGTIARGNNWESIYKTKKKFLKARLIWR